MPLPQGCFGDLARELKACLVAGKLKAPLTSPPAPNKSLESVTISHDKRELRLQMELRLLIS